MRTGTGPSDLLVNISLVEQRINGTKTQIEKVKLNAIQFQIQFQVPDSAPDSVPDSVPDSPDNNYIFMALKNTECCSTYFYQNAIFSL